MTKRTTITIQEDIEALAQEVMAARRFKDFSGFLAQLIREEHERRNGPMTLKEAPGHTVSTPAGSRSTGHDPIVAAVTQVELARASAKGRRK